MGAIETPFTLPVTPTELSYASGDLPGHINFRFNRTGRSTSDQDPIPTKDGFINEDLRAGGPHLCEMPCTSIKPLPGQCKAHDNLLHNETLFDEIIVMVPDFHGLHFLGRVPARQPHREPRSTLAIVARRFLKHCDWVELALKIINLLKSNGIHGVVVTIVDVRFVMISRFFDLLPCRQDDAISSIWDAVVESIFDAIGVRGVCAIGCYRIQSPYTRTTSDEPVTVIVGVDQRARRSWKPVREAIISVLDQWTLRGVGVLIRQDTKGVDVTWDQFVPYSMGISTDKIELDGTIGSDDMSDGTSIGAAGW
ncbi:hypothetical protein BJX96DRAFT_175112 [Aspergillus floccosus]